jgi:hypothetical protein
LVAGPRATNCGPNYQSSDWISDDFDEDVALPRAIEFVEEDSLPGTKNELAAFDEDGLAGAGESRFHVGVAIAFGVAIRALMWDEGVEDPLHIRRDIRISVFVDRDACCGVWNIDVAEPLLRSGIANGVFDFPCDVYELRAAGRFYSKSFHAVNRELWNGNNEVRTNVFDAGMAFDLFKALLAPASGER